MEEKMIKQEASTLEMKTSLKSKISSEVQDVQKTLGDKISTQEGILTNRYNQQMEDLKKTVEDKISVQDKNLKEATEKIAQLERGQSSSSLSGGDSSNLNAIT